MYEELVEAEERRVLLPLTALLKKSRKRLRAFEQALREKATWSPVLPDPILAPYEYYRYDYAIAGRAFDYWLRAFLSVCYRVVEGPTIIDMLAERPSDYDGHTVTEDNGQEIPLAIALISVARKRHEAIAAHKILSKSFLENCIEHGMLEGIYRAGEIAELSCPSEIMVEDLHAMADVAIMNRAIFGGRKVDLNPRFEHVTFAADGDFAIGNRLVDIKTTKDLVPSLAFSQVVCYAVIEAWARGASLEDLRYCDVGVYSARYAAIGVVHLRDVAGLIPAFRRFLEESEEQHLKQQQDGEAETVASEGEA